MARKSKTTTTTPNATPSGGATSTRKQRRNSQVPEGGGTAVLEPPMGEAGEISADEAAILSEGPEGEAIEQSELEAPVSDTAAPQVFTPDYSGQEAYAGLD